MVDPIHIPSPSATSDTTAQQLVMANSDTLHLLLEKLVLRVEETRWVNSTLVPSITLMVFDWFLTLDMEASLVWNAPWSKTKLLFLFTRYLPFIDISLLAYFQLGYALPQRVCKLSFEYVAWAFVIGQSAAILILTVRTWAVCGKSKQVGYGLFGMFGIGLTAVLTLNGLYLGSSKFQTSLVPQLIGCAIEANSSYIASNYVFLMFYDGGLLLFMIAQGVSACNFTFSFYSVRGAGNSQLTRVVYRDGILYYVYIFGLSLINTVVILKLDGAYTTMLIPIERVAYSILACRVILHIREQGRKLSSPSEQMTEPLHFAQITQRTGQVVTGASGGLGGGV